MAAYDFVLVRSGPRRAWHVVPAHGTIVGGLNTKALCRRSVHVREFVYGPQADEEVRLNLCADCRHRLYLLQLEARFILTGKWHASFTGGDER